MAHYSGVGWEQLMNSYQTRCETHNAVDTDLFTYFPKLRKLLERKSVNFWNGKYLEKYLDDGLAPFGLQVQIFPNLGVLTEDFKTRWEEILLECSANMMHALISEYSRIRDEADRKLQLLQQSYPAISAAEQFVVKDQGLQAFLERFNHNLIVSKEKRFIRDKTAFLLEKAFGYKK